MNHHRRQKCFFISLLSSCVVVCFLLGCPVCLLDQEKTASRPQCLVGRGDRPALWPRSACQRGGCMCSLPRREREREKRPPGAIRLSVFSFFASFFFFTQFFFPMWRLCLFLFFISRRHREQQMMQWDGALSRAPFLWPPLVSATRTGHACFSFFFSKKKTANKKDPPRRYVLPAIGRRHAPCWVVVLINAMRGQGSWPERK